MDDQYEWMELLIRSANNPEPEFKPTCDGDLQQDKTLAEKFKEYVVLPQTAHRKLISLEK
jgi:hypothetical protein